MHTYPTYSTTDHLTRDVTSRGSFYFSADTLRFFQARLDTQLFGGRFMVESIRRDDSDPRAYRVLFVSVDGTTGTATVEHLDTGRRDVPEYAIDGDTYRSLDSARRAARRAAALLDALTVSADVHMKLDMMRG